MTEQGREAAVAGSAVPSIRELGADLMVTSRARLVMVIALPFLSAAAYFIFALYGLWPLAVLAVMVLSFVSYGSSSHDLVHCNLPLPRRLNNCLLSLMEMVCLRSGRAYQLSHLHHHRRFPHDDDVEAFAVRGSLLRTLMQGPLQQFRLWGWAWRHHRDSRLLLAIEAAWFFAFLVGSVVVLPLTPIPIIYAASIIAGSWTIPLITVFIPHDPNGKTALQQTRCFRGRFYDVIAFGHLYHLEHHLYPMVPHHHWRELAQRLDPYFEKAGLRAYRAF